MSVNSSISRAIIRIEIQAPWTNFVPTMTTVTTPVATAPTALIVRLTFHAPSLSLSQRLTMPDCERVNEANTPTAYSGMRRVTSPPKATSQTDAAAATQSMRSEEHTPE